MRYYGFVLYTNADKIKVLEELAEMLLYEVKVL